jgi:hypothetical protein
MNITSYASFLDAVNSQLEPQRLLFVFAESELPPNATEAQKQRFQAGQGGTLTPVMCVDKLPSELGDFASLVEESRKTGAHWHIVFAAALSGRAGVAPTSDAAEPALKKMIGAIQQGDIGKFLAFNREGELIRLS